MHAFLAIICAALSGAGFILKSPAFGVLWAILAILQALCFSLVSGRTG
jgi:hypothetical protein